MSPRWLTMTDTIAHSARSDDLTPHRPLTDPTWLAGGALWLVAGLVHSGGGWRFDTSAVLWLVADVFIAAGLVRLLGRGPHGRSALGTAALGAALVARVAFAGGEVASLLQGHDNSFLIPVGALLTALAMTVYGGWCCAAAPLGARRGGRAWRWGCTPSS